MTAPSGEAERARAVLLELFPEGFEEADRGSVVELAVYTGAAGEDQLARAFGTTASSPVADGWQDAWRSFHRGVQIGPLWVGPPWQAPPPGSTAVWIDPGRAFGTGSHATTRLCLELLLGLAPSSLLDVGCGSGVLAIAAARLGFHPVVALDVDHAATEAAARNAAANGVRIDVRLGDATTTALPAADVAVANIAAATVSELAPRLRSTHLIASGYLEPELSAVPGYRPVLRRVAEGWAADLYAADSPRASRR